MANQDVRVAAKAAGVKLWQIAEELGIADSAFSRKLGHELPEETRRKVLAIIEELGKEAS